ncbi:MAG: chromate transporter [Limnochordia bacterium]|jgi:chromate transporter
MLLYLNIIFIFFKIGLLTIGGGYAMLPLIQKELISRGWLSAREFVDIVAIAEMTPGPIAINAATFVGYRLDGVLGSIAATTSIALPSFLLIILLSKFLEQFETSPVVQGAFQGIRPAVAGLIASAAIYISYTALVGFGLGSGNWWQGLANTNPVQLAITVIIFISLQKTKLHPIAAIILAGITGVIFL